MFKNLNTKQRLFEMMKKLNSDFKFNENNSLNSFSDNPSPKFIIPIGISGSGKSRWIKELTQTNLDIIIISPDEIRRELTGNISDQTHNKEVFPIVFERAITALNSNKSVVFDATNINSKLRKQMLGLLKEKVVINFEALAKVFDVDPEVSKQRVQNDIERGVDRSNVPPEAIDRQHRVFISDLNQVENDGYRLI